MWQHKDKKQHNMHIQQQEPVALLPGQSHWLNIELEPAKPSITSWKRNKANNDINKLYRMYTKPLPPYIAKRSMGVISLICSTQL